MLYKFINICDGNKFDGDSNRKKNKRIKEEVRNVLIIDKRFYG